MPVVTVPIVNAFVDNGQGGNPAGVVLNAERFDQATKQVIAAMVGLSETAFVSPSQVADFKLEFFTPNRQIAHCGHATIATFSYLVQQGLLTKTHSSKETIDGTRAIFIDGEMAFMEQLAPTYTRLGADTVGVTTASVLESLMIRPSDLLGELEPTVVNTGNSFLIVPLRSAAAVRSVVPDQSAIYAISDLLGLIGYYVFSPEAMHTGHDAGARMFAPLYSIPEEAATGMAAGGLACFLYDHLDLKKPTFLIEQGHFMTPPSPSKLTVRLNLRDGAISSLMVGGRARVSRSVDVPIP